jgi:serine/threonine protein kinase
VLYVIQQLPVLVCCEQCAQLLGHGLLANLAGVARLQHVSDDCKDLLRGLLTADPRKRLTVAQVQSHPWFRQDLPAGALEVNSRLKLMDNVRWGRRPST